MGAQDLSQLLQSTASQYNRLVKLDTSLGSDILLPQRVSGHSRIGRDYQFTLDVVSLSGAIELKSLIAQPATLWLQQSESESYLPFNGYIHTARRLGADGQLTSYQLILSTWMYFLRFRKDARIFQEKSTDSIIQEIFAEHPQASGAFRFEVRNPAPVRSFCMQYESDYNFVHRLLESEGWFYTLEQASDGKSHTLVITDDIYSLKPLTSQQVEFYRSDIASESDTLVQWAGSRELQSATYSFSTVDYKNPLAPKSQSIPAKAGQGDLPNQAEIYEYGGAYTYNTGSRGDDISRFRMEELESRAKRFYGTGSVRRMDAGRWFELANHPDSEADSEQNRQFVVIETRWYIENNLPVGDSQPFPFSLQNELEHVRLAHQGADGASAATKESSSVGFFLVEIEAQRRIVPYRSPFEHHKPVLSTQTATVVGPSGEEVYTDNLNRVKVRMNWDRSDDQESSSCWMRVMSTHAGSNFGGVYVPRIGQEVVVTFLDGDCDRPLVSGAVFNGNQVPQWHTQGTMSGYKSKEYKGDGFNQLVFDDTTGQNRTQLFSSTGSSLLHLGYLIDQQDNTRGAFLGSGFNLKTDNSGAVRAAQGLFLTTFARTGTTAQQMDVKEAYEHLVQSGGVIESRSEAAASAQAETLTDAHTSLNEFAQATQTGSGAATSAAASSALASSAATSSESSNSGKGQANNFQKPLILLAGSEDIGLATQSSIQLAATQHINLVSGVNTTLAASGSFLASIKQKLSIFVEGAGMKLFAGRGKIEVQAQTDNIELTADRTFKVTSTSDSVEIQAQKEICLKVGGATLQMKDGSLYIHCPGAVEIKGASHTLSGPQGDSASSALPTVESCAQKFGSAAQSGAALVS
ncbi:type VI secretion system tip protein VgrG [Paraburkholderia sp. Ac-20340]|uniref:type VI secretion system Vgr family protein n=1 Tax=Paraburkholderia sp. Ac-20340 TaxID=2703888 RepID=UPI0019817D9F|nr:type VI secretion system Vgr family protein [Paraburkholderia sp. Ac-20340]MBN3853331.1 type VI secretion system tip protein VgrG [Paraburkholderia sp. Ac-20340]